MIHKLFRCFIFMLFFLLVYFTLGNANASAVNLNPQTGDLSIIFLGNLFGVVDGVLAGTGSQIAGVMFGVFNSAILALAGIVVSYTLFISTMNSAQEGQFIGQRLSSVWVPVRSVGGAALMLPKASGYCLMQIFIMWVAVQGVGAADRVWEEALSYLNKGGVLVQANISATTAMSEGNDSSIFNVAYGLLTAQVCMISLERTLIKYQKEVKADSSTCANAALAKSPDETNLFCTMQVPNFIDSVNFLDVAGLAKGPVEISLPNIPENTATKDPFQQFDSVCGKIKYNNFVVSDDNESAMSLSTSEANTLRSTRAVAINQMYTYLTGISQKIVDNAPFLSGTSCYDANNSSSNSNLVACTYSLEYGVPLTLSYEQCIASTNPKNKICYSWNLENGTTKGLLFSGREIHDAVSVYNGMMSASLYIKSQFSSTTNYRKARKFIDEAKQTGWILAGAYYFKLAILNSQVLQNSGGITADTGSGLSICTPLPTDTTTDYCGPGNWSTTDFEEVFTYDMCASSKSSKINSLFCTNGNVNTVGKPTLIQSISNIVALIRGTNSPVLTQQVNVPKIVNNALIQPTYTADNAFKYPNSVYGFLVNSTAVVLPGQPGSSQPKIEFVASYNPTSNVPVLAKSNISGGKWNIPGQIMTGIYNYFIRFILNLMLSIITPIINLLIFTLLQRPLMLVASVFFGAMTVLQDKNVNPIIGITNMGVGFIEGTSNVWLLLVIDYIVVAIIAIFNPFLGFVLLGILFMLMPIVTIWLGILLSVGLSATFYLPFVPFMIFLFATIGWLIGVIEAMVAGPLIALGVMHPEGERPFGRGDQAVTLLLGLFLRPSMMIFGYIFGIILSYVGLWFINSGFKIIIPAVENMKMVNIDTSHRDNYDPSADINQGLNGADYGENMNTMDNAFSDANDGINSGMQKVGQFVFEDTTIYGMWSRIFLIFFILLVYITSIISVVSKSFELIHLLPDRVMRWISDGQTDNLAGKVSGTMKSDIKGAHKKASDKTGEAMAKINSGLMEGAAKKISEAKDSVRDKFDADESDAEGGDDDEADGEDDEKGEESVSGGKGGASISGGKGGASISGGKADDNKTKVSTGTAKGSIGNNSARNDDDDAGNDDDDAGNDDDDDDGGGNNNDVIETRTDE